MPQIRNFTEAQDLLRPYYDNSRTAYTLDLMRALMEYLGNPQNKLKVLHVAGTSGKTSTAYYCAALLKESGKSVGLSVSPHVDTVNERLQINGLPLPEAEFCAVLGAFVDLVMASGLKPSYFELLVAMAYWEFARRGLDYVVMEVGLGGLLDGSNVVDSANKVCVITDIGFDHTEILGDTLAQIASQKAGIIQRNNAVFMYQQNEEVMDVVEKVTTQQQASLHAQSPDSAVTYQSLPLFQQRNLGLAAKAVDYVLNRDADQHVSDEALQQAASIVVPARLERFKIGDKLVIVDGSHNQQKLATLLESVSELYPGKDIAAVCAFVEGNDERWQGGLQELTLVAKHLIFTNFYSEQDVPKSSVDPAKLVAFCDAHNFKSYEVMREPAAAYEALLARAEPVLVVTGSFYLLNHIRPLMKVQA
ncbi:MAG: Bifunctional protein FolC [Candidatus Saccharibacteria bacterium]|nr:Bifunctional protein FolC [Candidatus Saccharibacteria bacterium]